MVLWCCPLSSRLTAWPWAGQNLWVFEPSYLYRGITSPDPLSAPCFCGGKWVSVSTMKPQRYDPSGAEFPRSHDFPMVTLRRKSETFSMWIWTLLSEISVLFCFSYQQVKGWNRSLFLCWWRGGEGSVCVCKHICICIFKYLGFNLQIRILVHNMTKCCFFFYKGFCYVH